MNHHNQIRERSFSKFTIEEIIRIAKGETLPQLRIAYKFEIIQLLLTEDNIYPQEVRGCLIQNIMDEIQTLKESIR